MPPSLSAPAPALFRDWDDDDDDDDARTPSTLSSESDDGDDEQNKRLNPHWPAYRTLLQSRGLHLDTVRDVKAYYAATPSSEVPLHFRAALANKFNDDDLCPDPGLPDHLNRGTRQFDGKKFVVKAVHLGSRQYQIIRMLSQSPLKDDPMNHTIPVLDLLEVVEDQLAMIVMEQWSSQLITGRGLCCLDIFLGALRELIEHAVFLHKNNIAHLDISLRNVLTDYHHHYAYIDYELSRWFENNPHPRISGARGTEMPPECESGQLYDPYKIDVWAMAILILRACQLTGYDIPELLPLTTRMLSDIPEQRPSMPEVLHGLDSVISPALFERMPEKIFVHMKMMHS